MIARWVVAHKRLVCIGSLAVWTAGSGTFLIIVLAYGLDFFGPLGGPFVVGFGAFTITGALIAWHRPGHPLGLLYLVIGLASPVSNTLAALATGPFAARSFELRTLFIALSVAVTTPIFALLPLSIVIFPDGRLPSRRWRWMPWLVVGACLIGSVAALSAGAWGGDVDQAILGPPFGGALLGLAGALSPLFFGTVPILIVASATAAILRYQRSDTRTRQQLKWLALASLALVMIVAGLFATQGAVAAPPGTPAVVISIGVALIPISAGFAILRHGLYDIDLVLNRTIVFGTLAAFITALYSATVVGIGSLIGDASNLVLTVGATALVAVAFEPVRSRVQHWANRAVYGRRASPYEVLTAIVDELPSGASSDDQLDGLAALLADGTGAKHATVWVEVGGSFRAAACSLAHDPAEHGIVPTDGEGRVDLPQLTYVEPVRLDGDLLGALSFERGRDDPVTPHDRALFAGMAGQASLVLGNARLRERLRARVEQLRASRQRLVAAQDEARRKLERDLHDGAQQQLVALKVKLGLARTIAAKEQGGEQTTALIEELSRAADAAVESLRALARGIYPPLLEAEGLERALRSQLLRSAIPVDLRVEGLRRYDRQVEATVFFCVLEVVRNALIHAAATDLEVLLEDPAESLCLFIDVNGAGFDPTAMVHGLGLTTMGDRIDALGGTLAIETAVGSGVRIVGTIPVTDRIRARRPPDGLATV